MTRVVGWHWCKSQGSKAREPGVLMSGGRRRWMSCPSSREESANLPFLCLFVPFRPSVDWMGSGPIGKAHLLNSVYGFQCSSFPQTPLWTHQLPGPPLTQSGWHVKLTNTLDSLGVDSSLAEHWGENSLAETLGRDIVEPWAENPAKQWVNFWPTDVGRE